VTHAHGVGLAREDQNGGFFHGVSPYVFFLLLYHIFGEMASTLEN
jgi:hypothetical protein